MVGRDIVGCAGVDRSGRRRLSRWSVTLGAATIACVGAFSAAPTTAGAAHAMPPRMVGPHSVARHFAFPRSLVNPPMIGAAGAAPRVAGAPSTPVRSLNWGGYAVNGSRGDFSA